VSDILTATSLGRADVVSELLKAESDRANALNRYECTPLHLAAREGYPAVGEALLRVKSQVDRADAYGYTALHYASAGGHAAFIRVLLKHKANVSAKQGRDYEQPIHFAAASGSRESVQLLLDAGADAKAEDVGSWFTPLHIAAAKGDAAVIELLVARKADVKAMDTEGRTPLHLAAERGQRAGVEALLRAKVPPDLRQKRTNRTAVHLAATKDHADVLKTLLTHGAAVDAIDSEGQSALHLAASQQNIKAANELIAANANVNLATPSSKDTPLHYAAAAGDVEMVQLLLSHKADPNAKNKAGSTPYDLAKELEMKQLAELLRKAAKPQ
jgi:cytohesin